MDQTIWLITGASSGLGKAMAEYAISQGCFVIGTFRQANQAEAFKNKYKKKVSTYIVELSKHEDILQMLKSIELEHGRIDVLMNNAGYGLMGAIEEISIEEARDQMEINFFSVFYLSQKALPLLRKSSKASIFQISSSAGVKGEAGLGLYNASKFAVEGFSEALAEELGNTHISVTIVEPGPFRTQFGGSSIKESLVKLPQFYKNTAHKLIENIRLNSGKQDGDPDKAVKLIYQLSLEKNPPLHFPLGKFAHEQIIQKMHAFKADMDAWKASTLHTQFDEHG